MNKVGPHFAQPQRTGVAGLSYCAICGEAVEPVPDDSEGRWWHTTFMQLARKGGSW